MISVQRTTSGAEASNAEFRTDAPRKRFRQNETDIRAENALREACLLGRLGFVTALLEMGVSVHATNENGDTPLIHAAVQGNPRVVKRLLEAGADVEAQNPHGITALMEAAFWGNVEVVEILIQHGANITCQDRAGRTALEWAIQGGRKEVIDSLFSRRKSLRDEFLRVRSKGESIGQLQRSDSSRREGIVHFELQ